MAKKYIEVNELKEWVENFFYQHRFYHPYSKSNDIPVPELYDILERMPAADVVEVRHGRWEDVKGYEGLLYRCSECEDKHYKHTTIKYDYCPYCGAKMDEVEE